jgi:LemA protein
VEPILLVIGGVVLLIVVFVVGIYNRFVRLRNHCDEAWSNIDTELQRRYDLIPNLVNTIKGYAAHEKEVLEEVTRLRALCVDDHGQPGHQAGTENRMLAVLGPLLARVENYPDLKADKNFLQLQEELVFTEDRIQAARRFYNGNVRENNNKVQMFPSSIVANAFKFSEREFFEIRDVRAYATPKAEFHQ